MKILLIVLAVLAFLLFVPLCIRLTYKGELSVYVGVLVPFIRVFSTGAELKNKKEKPKRKKEQKEKNTVDKGALWELVKQIPGHMKRLLTVQKLKLFVRVGHQDPGDLALLYGTANAVVDTAAVTLSPIYPREKWQVEILPDFDAETTQIEGQADAYTNLWRIIYVLISLLFCGILNVKSQAGE